MDARAELGDGAINDRTQRFILREKMEVPLTGPRIVGVGLAGNHAGSRRTVKSICKRPRAIAKAGRSTVLTGTPANQFGDEPYEVDRLAQDSGANCSNAPKRFLLLRNESISPDFESDSREMGS